MPNREHRYNPDLDGEFGDYDNFYLCRDCGGEYRKQHMATHDMCKDCAAAGGGRDELHENDDEPLFSWHKDDKDSDDERDQEVGPGFFPDKDHEHGHDDDHDHEDDHKNTNRQQRNEGYNFDKFMDSILINESKQQRTAEEKPSDNKLREFNRLHRDAQSRIKF